MSDLGGFWDQRYSKEGDIWGDTPSPTAILATRRVNPGDCLLDVGFGYGRDVAHFAHYGCRVWGIDLSVEGRRLAEEHLAEQSLQPEALLTGAFEEWDFGETQFDLIHSHRVAHLLVTRKEIDAFAKKSSELLTTGGILCIGARNRQDLKVEDMTEVGEGVFEYRARPGHRIRYWDDSVFTETFEDAFDILELEQAVEIESVEHPVPCRFSIMIGRRKGDCSERNPKDKGAA